MKKILIASPEELPPELADDPSVIVIAPEDVDDATLQALDAASGGLVMAEDEGELPPEEGSFGEDEEEEPPMGGEGPDDEDKDKAPFGGEGPDEDEEQKKKDEEAAAAMGRGRPQGRGGFPPARGGRGVAPLGLWAQSVAGRRLQTRETAQTRLQSAQALSRAESR